jgi:hypothetical protein
VQKSLATRGVIAARRLPLELNIEGKQRPVSQEIFSAATGLESSAMGDE